MDEFEYNKHRAKIIDGRLSARHKIFSVLLPTFSAILAVSCIYGISTSRNIDFSLGRNNIQHAANGIRKHSAEIRG